MLSIIRSVLSASNELLHTRRKNFMHRVWQLFDREWANIQGGQAWAEKNLQDSPVAASLCSSYPERESTCWICACIHRRRFAGWRRL